ncbi:MAG: alpha/beta fold hydrolase [Candidatus Eremiobacteraeota bacterium]|nr:alpha/beta fold hydrolase [Candidatus Eremiobacteraeota bacterium]
MKVDLIRVSSPAAELAVLVYEARRPRGVSIVAGHGYSSSKHNLDFLCGFLAGHGFQIYSLDFPGHKLGASGGRLRSDEDLISSMHAVFAHARQQSEGPVYMLGHSMGAMTALRTAAREPTISGAIAIATGYGRPSALAALRSMGATDFRDSYVDGLTLPELSEHLDAALDRDLPKLAGRPALYIAADRDMMVSQASVRELFDRAPEPKSFVTISSDHTTAGEAARAPVLQWLNGRHPR